MSLDLETWLAHEQRIDLEQVEDGLPLLDRVPRDFVATLTPRDALALRYAPEAYLRPRQIIDDAGDWLTCVHLGGRGGGKSLACAAWTATQVQRGGDYALVAPTLREAWDLQWRVIRDECLPPWVRYVERVSHDRVDFPDHDARLLMHSSEVTSYRGPNLRGAWIEEPTRFARGAELWRNLDLAIRMPGPTPPRAVISSNPPNELGWILELCTQPTTRVVRYRMRDNPMLDRAKVAAKYAALDGTVEGRRELDGEVVLGSENALVSLEDLDRYRVGERPPAFLAVVVAVDPAQSKKRDADVTGICAIGIAAGHLYVIESCVERMAPAEWAQRAIDMAERHNAGRFVVEPTGSGSYPGHTLTAQITITKSAWRRIVESKAKGSKSDRAQPLAAMAAQGRLHLIGQHPALERDLTQWEPTSNWSPGGLDSLVHGAAVLTNDWKNIR